MINMVKRFLPHEFRQRLKCSLFVQQDMNTRILNLRKAGFTPSGAIDGGAYQGEWTRAFWSVWPDSPCLMIEPQSAQLPKINPLAAQTRGSSVAAKAIGAQSGKVSFQLGETDSRILGDTPQEGAITVECVTLDELLAGMPGFKPNLFKLDLQGYELQALAGASGCLSSFEVIIQEVSILRIGDVPIFSEIDHFMETKGYGLYDVLPQFYRPRDGALWQMDVFYARQDSALIASRSWA